MTWDNRIEAARKKCAEYDAIEKAGGVPMESENPPAMQISTAMEAIKSGIESGSTECICEAWVLLDNLRCQLDPRYRRLKP